MGASPSRFLGSVSMCGTNWSDANDTCLDVCESDEDCGPGRYCFHYMECTPPQAEAEAEDEDGALVYEEELSSFQQYSASASASAASSPVVSTPSAASPSAPSPSSAATPTPNYMPAYIASLPVRPSEPTTYAPFVLPVPTPNTLPNPNGNYCGYGYESANAECFHACPSGKDEECPGGRTCHAWLKCTPPPVDPAVYNVCGSSWAHASTSCATRCYLGVEGICPEGQTCWGGVVECEGNEDLPPLTAVDVGLEERSYTIEEIKVLLDEEIEKERGEEAMKDPDNWWCGTSWSNMLETCAKRCTTDDDCKMGTNSWDPSGTCYQTTGGAENCAEVGGPAKEPVPEGSRWCGTTWNDMLETCAAKCEADEDCGDGKKCWEGPDTCMYVGVPVKAKSDPTTLWCGYDYDDAMTSCHKQCMSESDDECDEGMSCFAGSECVEAGVPIVREGYRCGLTWDDASLTCGTECQMNEDCDEGEGQECFAEVVCEKDKEDMEAGGMYCGTTWEGTAKACNEGCEVDEDCGDGRWCYWVECEGEDDDENEEEDDDADSSAMEEPEEEDETPASCNAEVMECPNGDYVGRAQELDCEFYPCPDEDDDEAAAAEDDGDGDDDEEVEEDDEAEEEENSDSSTAEAPAGGGGEASGGGGEAPATDGGVDMSGWGSTPLDHACTSDGSGSCGLCQGDCGSDLDCSPGLLCFSRGSGEMTSVPGCVSGGEGDKPGMDYCYAPFPPEEPEADDDEPMAMMAGGETDEEEEEGETTTNPGDADDDDDDEEDASSPIEDEEDTSAAIEEEEDTSDPIEDEEDTSVSTEEEETSFNPWEDDDEEGEEQEEQEEEEEASVELVYARECTEDEPCGQCEGDCDDDSQCASGLECFVRDEGSVEFVTGCSGLGTAGELYCWRSSQCVLLPPPPLPGLAEEMSTLRLLLCMFTQTVLFSFTLRLFLILLGMDYCYDPNSSVPQPTSGSDGVVVGGCSAEVLFCPGGHIVTQDPSNNCEFGPCPTTASSMVASSSAASDESDNPVPTATPSMTVPASDASLMTETAGTPSPTADDSLTVQSETSVDASTFYCGYSLDQVNDNCQSAKPCPYQTDDECDGMEVCLSGTSCGSMSTSANMMATTPSEDTLCDELCLEALPTEFCPSNLALPNCLEVGLGEVCEANGECGTDDKLNNCGTYDIYARVVCGFATPSQGELMRSTTSPTPSVPVDSTALLLSASPASATPKQSPLVVTVSPTPPPLAAAVTLIVAQTSAPTINVAASPGTNDTLTTTQVASSAGSLTVSIADAIANATANANATQSSSSLPEYESNVAAAFTFDRDQGSGGTNEAASTAADGASVAGSGEWFNTDNGESPGDSDGVWEAPTVSDGGWNFDTAYFQAPISSGIPSWRNSFYDPMLIIVGMMTVVVFAW